MISDKRIRRKKKVLTISLYPFFSVTSGACSTMDLTVSPWYFYTAIGLLALLVCLRIADYLCCPPAPWSVQTGEREPLVSHNDRGDIDNYYTVESDVASAPPLDYDEYFNHSSLVLCDD